MRANLKPLPTILFAGTMLLCDVPAMAQDTQVAGTPAQRQAEVHFEHPRTYSREENLFEYVDNPTLASGLVSGVKSLNQSVESLMESVFYNVMDQEFPLPLADNFNLFARYERRLHETSLGSYVIVDQFRLGPGYSRELASFADIPIRLGAESGLDVVNISHSSDANRAARHRTLPFWQAAVNNWFGLLPFLSRILPPSFNPLELYDPLKYLKTPFLFPRHADHARRMPVGDIRSIGISGGLAISADVLEPELAAIQKELRLPDLDFKLPYGIFKTGRHRLHLLRKSEHIFWLAITDQNEIGHKVDFDLRNNFRVFDKLIPIWRGEIAPIFPIDLFLAQAHIKRFDELYSFDLRLPKAREAFNDAVRGNLITASRFANQDAPSGVVKYFDRQTSAFEDRQKITRSFYVEHKERRHTLRRSFITLQVDETPEHALEVEYTMRDRNWDLLVGADHTRFENRVYLDVIKGRNQAGDIVYYFDPEDPAPYSLKAQLNIRDDFLDAREFHKLIGLARFYTALPLVDNIPKIPLLAQDEVRQFTLEHQFQHPMRRIHVIEPTPIHLGDMNLHAEVHFPHDYLVAIAKHKPYAIRRAVALAFEEEPTRWHRTEREDRYWRWFMQGISYLLRPLRLFNIRTPRWDLVVEQERVIAALSRLRAAETPVAIAEAFESLLDTAYPGRLVRTLILLGPYKETGRHLEFHTRSTRSDRDSPDTQQARRQFEKLNQMTIQAGPAIPPSPTQKLVDDKLAAFAPTGQEFLPVAPELKGLTLATASSTPPFRALKLELKVRPTRPLPEGLKVYVRVEQSGSVNLGRFVLFERIATATAESETSGGLEVYPLALTASDVVTDNLFFDQTLAIDSRLDLYVSISEDGHQWSREHMVQFAISPSGHIETFRLGQGR
jgi:hypothetical protein